MRRVVINDANILIDLVHLELLSIFSKLDFELFTTDFILEELNLQQRSLVDELVKLHEIFIIKTAGIEDYSGIVYLLEQTNGLSFEDCSVWYYSMKLKGILLTGDSKLKKHAEASEVEVHGILFIFDAIVTQKLLTPTEAASKLAHLKQLNIRLPENEIEKRIRKWEE